MPAAARQRQLLTLLAATCVVPTAIVPVRAADADHPAAPEIDLVAPMRAPVGEDVVIRGRNFSRKTRFSTVVFRGPRGGAAFARPIRAFPRKLVVRVPTTVERLMRTADDDASTALPTRFRLRVVSERRRSKLTGPLRSPLVVPAPPEG